MNTNMKEYDKAKENELLRKLFILAARRSMRPSMQENRDMWVIFQQLEMLTEKDEYKL